MFKLYDFKQDKLLKGITDPEVQGGVCVALCDHWFQGLREHPKIAPDMRLQVLAGQLNEVIMYQKRYGRQRALDGPVIARQDQAQRLGLQYTEQTTIMRNPLGQPRIAGLTGTRGIRDRLMEDLERPFSGAVWSMRFSQAGGGGGHALAGYNMLASAAENLHSMELHVFDPNIGEYVGEMGGLDAILADIFGKFPDYDHVEEVRRATEA